jgi:hypothetical protein
MLSRTIRLAFVFLALTLLAGGTAQAMPLGEHPQSAAPGGLFDAVLVWITDLFLGGEKEGCEMDPNGLDWRILTNSSPISFTHDEGVEMDPNG